MKKKNFPPSFSTKISTCIHFQKRYIKTAIFLLCLISILCFPYMATAGGGWTKEKGKSFLKVSQWWIKSSRHFTATGSIVGNRETKVQNSSLYIEHGITDRVTALMNFTFFSKAAHEAVDASGLFVAQKAESISTLGDSDFGMKLRLSNSSSKIPVAATLVLGIPLGKNNGGKEKKLHTGDGEFNQMIRLDASKSFTLHNHINLYSTLYVGLNNRTKKFSDEFRWGFEVGGEFIHNRLWFIYRMDAIHSFKNGSVRPLADGASLFSNNVEYYSYTVEVTFKVSKKIGISYASGSAFKGRLIYANGTNSLGIFIDLF